MCSRSATASSASAAIASASGARPTAARVGDPEVGGDLVGPDLSALAAAYGLPATAVPSVGDGLASALAKAVGAGGPHLVHVRARLTPPRTTSPRWRED